MPCRRWPANSKSLPEDSSAKGLSGPRQEMAAQLTRIAQVEEIEGARSAEIGRARLRPAPAAVRGRQPLPVPDDGAAQCLDLHLRDAVGRGGLQSLHLPPGARGGRDGTYSQSLRLRTPEPAVAARGPAGAGRQRFRERAAARPASRSSMRRAAAPSCSSPVIAPCPRRPCACARCGAPRASATACSSRARRRANSCCAGFARTGMRCCSAPRASGREWM